MLVISTVTLVLGDPMLDILAVSPFVWDAMKASPAPRPETLNSKYFREL